MYAGQNTFFSLKLEPQPWALSEESRIFNWMIRALFDVGKLELTQKRWEGVSWERRCLTCERHFLNNKVPRCVAGHPGLKVYSKRSILSTVLKFWTILLHSLKHCDWFHGPHHVDQHEGNILTVVNSHPCKILVGSRHVPSTLLDCRGNSVRQ